MHRVEVRNALISVYRKQGLEPLLRNLAHNGVNLFASGGTADYIRSLGLNVEDVSRLTHFPPLLDGRVKTLHPAVFAGILANRSLDHHMAELDAHNLPSFDLVVVDLYPFEETLQQTGDEAELIEKIDVGGVALLRAAAKNHHDVLVCPGAEHVAALNDLLTPDAASSLDDRKHFARLALQQTAAYDHAISQWLAGSAKTPLRYGENPHQQAWFEGNFNSLLQRHSSHDLSYNNLLDLDAGLRLLADLELLGLKGFAIFKHSVTCGFAVAESPLESWQRALASDPVSAFGCVAVTNHAVDLETAQALDAHFYEAVLAPAYHPEALELLLKRQRRNVLAYNSLQLPARLQRTALNGLLWQQADPGLSSPAEWQCPAGSLPGSHDLPDWQLAELLCKHLKSNAIAIVAQGQLLGKGSGQTSRVDAMNQALGNLQRFAHSPQQAVLASDGFFPFADGVQLAHQHGITRILQPGGSIRDQESIQYCQQHNLSLVLTGQRHFKH